MNQPTPQEQHEARLTAYALDELGGDERVAVERLLAAGTPEAAAAALEVARIREIGTQLARELARDLGDGDAPALTPAQRAAISRAASPARPRTFLRWSLAAACTALAAALAVVVLVPGGGPGGQEVAAVAPAAVLTVADEKGGRNLARAASAAPMKPAAASEVAKQEAQRRPPGAARPELSGAADALEDKRDAAVAANGPARKQAHAPEASSTAALASPVRPAASAADAASGAGLARANRAGEQTEGALGGASAAPAPAAAAPVVAAAAPPAARLQQAVGGTSGKGGQQEPSAPGPVNGLAGVAAMPLPANAPPAEAAPALAARARFLQQGSAAPEERLKSMDKAAAMDRAFAAGAPAQDAAPAPLAAPALPAAPAPPATPAPSAGKAPSTADDGLMPTSIAAQIQVPLEARTASFDAVRRCLDAGRLPPPELVRIGDLINAVSIGQPPAPGGEPAAIAISAGPCPWQPDHRLLGIVIAARPVATGPRPPLNLVLVVDVSAAMRGDDRLALLKPGLAGLVRSLGPADRLSLVAYARQARLVFTGSGEGDAAAALAAISGLAPADEAGGADAAAGLALAAQALQRSHPAGGRAEVALCTAGAPDGGQALADQLRRLAADGVELQLMAVGHDHPEDGALERLADLGHGGFAYVSTAAQAAAACGGIGSPREVVARQAFAEIAINAAAIASYRLVGAQPLPSRRPVAEAYGGELCAGQAVTLLIEIAHPTPLAFRRLRAEVKDGAADADLVSVRLSYRLADGRTGAPITARLGAAEAAGQDRIPPTALAAAELGLALRHPGDPRYRWERMLANAEVERHWLKDGSARSDGLIDLITRAAALAAKGEGR